MLSNGERLTLWQVSDRINGTTKQEAIKKLKKVVDQSNSVTQSPPKKSVTQKKATLSVTQSKRKAGAPKGQANGNSDGIYIVAGVRYESLRQASKATNIRANTLSKVCKLGCSFEPKR